MPRSLGTAGQTDAAQVFRWHKAARLFDLTGAEVPRAAAFRALPDPDGGAQVLPMVLAGRGAAFRIGGSGDLQAGPGAFESLTGGSLGQPRRVIRSQASWCASFAVNAGLFGIGPGTGVAVLGGLVHSLALYAAIEALHLGADLHLLAPMRPDRQAQALAMRAVQVVYATPAQLRPVVSAAGHLPALRHVVVGGATLDKALRHAVRALAPHAVVHEFYGAAETSFVTLASGSLASDAAGCVGHAYPGVQLRVDGQGLVWVRSPYVFQGYAGADHGSAQRQGDWLTVGEIGQMTPQGLILRGRAGRMVTVADRNVFPEEIEQFLQTLPGVQRAAVLPVADAARGHVLLAVLAGDAAQEDSILRALRQKLGPTLAPKTLIWRQDWPLLASGKTDLARLQAEVASWR